MDRLKHLIEECAKRRIVVDCSLRREASSSRFPKNLQEHRACAVSLARELLPYRNVYLDLANERDVRDTRYVSIEEVGDLIAAVHEIDRGRLCTASGVPGSAGDLEAMLTTGRCDFIAPHLCRDDGCASKTVETVTTYSRWMAEIGRTVPIHLQEPFRRGYARYDPTADDFFRDASGAKVAGAAGWCLHNGSSRRSDGPRPYRSFLMTDEEGRLYDQWDEVERVVVDGLVDRVGGLTLTTLLFQAEYPEQLPHLVGRRDGDAWAVEAGKDEAGFLNYGPYLGGLPPGRYVAAFRLEASPGSEGKTSVLTLDVFNADANKVLQRRSVDAADLGPGDEPRELLLEFEHARGGHRLEFRSWWPGAVSVRLDGIEVRPR